MRRITGRTILLYKVLVSELTPWCMLMVALWVFRQLGSLTSIQQYFWPLWTHVTFGYFRVCLVFANPRAPFVGVTLNSCTNDIYNDIYCQFLSESSPRNFLQCIWRHSHPAFPAAPKSFALFSYTHSADSASRHRQSILPKRVAQLPEFISVSYQRSVASFSFCWSHLFFLRFR